MHVLLLPPKPVLVLLPVHHSTGQSLGSRGVAWNSRSSHSDILQDSECRRSRTDGRWSFCGELEPIAQPRRGNSLTAAISRRVTSIRAPELPTNRNKGATARWIDYRHVPKGGPLVKIYAHPILPRSTLPICKFPNPTQRRPMQAWSKMVTRNHIIGSCLKTVSTSFDLELVQ